MAEGKVVARSRGAGIRRGGWGGPGPWVLAGGLLLGAPGALAEEGEAGGDGAEETDPAGGTSAEDQAAIEAAFAGAAAPTVSAPPPGAGQVLQALIPDIAVIADVALAVFSADDPMQTGGHDPTATGFHLQQVELSIGKSVDPYFRLDGNIVFSLFGVEVEEIYATTLGLPAGLQVRLGQFLTRFGRVNPTHPHAWDFADQPLAIGRVFGGEGNRGLGAEVSVLLPLPWYVELVGSATGAAGEATARSFYGAQDLGVDSPLDFQYTAAIKQFFPLSDDWSLAWGLSYAGGPNPTGRTNRSEVFGTDLYLKLRPVRSSRGTMVALQTEWLYRRRQVPGDVLQDVNGYAQLLWRFAPRWGAGARYELGTPAGAGEDGTRDDLDPDWTTLRHRISANVTFWPTEFSRIRLQGSSDVADWRDAPVWAGFLAFEFVIGAHGAHAF